jgi:hypothetical protein
MLEVQTGVPLPKIDRAPKGKRRKYPLEGMEVGDMFFVPGRACKSVSAYISRISKGLPGTYSARHVWMREALPSETPGWKLADKNTPHAVEGTGVWRTE